MNGVQEQAEQGRGLLPGQDNTNVDLQGSIYGTRHKVFKPKKMACVECRQQKSKCDAQELHPDPCTKCAKKGIPCSLQANYKRTYKRAKFQQIEEELEELKKNLSEAGVESLLQQLKEKKFQPHELISHSKQYSISSSPTPSINSHTLPTSKSEISHSTQQVPTNNHISQQISQNHQTKPSVPLTDNGPSIIRESTPTNESIKPETSFSRFDQSIELSEEVLNCSPKEFGEIKLSSQQIRELYLEFVNKYHRFLPIVDISKGPERIHKLCPILFWTIVSVSLRQLSTDTLMKLAPLLKSALAEITISPITRYLPNENDAPILNVSSVYSVQAFLLYTYWPSLTSSLSADSSWNTVGIAVFQAIRLGLNGPGTNNYSTQQQPEMSSILQEHVKTWTSCNIVSQTIATAFGFPAFVSFDNSVLECSRQGTSSSLPKSIRHMVTISHFEDQIAKVLNTNNIDVVGLAEPTERLPLLKVLTQQLSEIELSLTNEGLDDIRKFQVYATKLHLLTYYFLDNARVASFELRRGLVSLYNSALNLLSHADMISKKDPNFMKYVPGVFVLKIWQASCIVAKLTHSTLADVIDVGAGRQLYLVGIQLALKASVLKHDMAYRASGIMRNMWQLFKALREKTNVSNLEVTIRSRMTASVFFDSLWILREQVGMIKLDPNEKHSSEENSNSNSNENEEFEDDDALESESADDEPHVADPGTVTSESSEAKSTTSSQKKRPRTLSNNYNAEYATRKIIRTIPLDPAPISLKRDQEKILRTITPSLKDILHSTAPSDNSGEPSVKRTRRKYRVQEYSQDDTSKQRATKANDISPTSIPSLDLSDDWTSDMLWRDVDSMMNDFGFNIDDITRGSNVQEAPGFNATIPPQANYQPPSLFPYNNSNQPNATHSVENFKQRNPGQ